MKITKRGKLCYVCRGGETQNHIILYVKNMKCNRNHKNLYNLELKEDFWYIKEFTCAGKSKDCLVKGGMTFEKAYENKSKKQFSTIDVLNIGFVAMLFIA